MAEPEVVISEDPTVDEDMAEGEDVDAGEPTAAGELTGLEDLEVVSTPERLTFLDCFHSPIIELVLGSGDSTTTLSAHKALLQQSPYLAEESSQGSTSISLPHEDVEACASVLEYLYRSDYFPALSNPSTMEYDPTVPRPDDTGIALLRHARVYTLAQKFGLPALAALAHKKIHLTQSTAKGEIAYARFVYKETSPDDEAIRRPVANFWATRSYVLRHEAEQEFRRMCLEFPQFGFDVLNLVLDQQEKRTQRQEAQSSGSGLGRKRQRVSQL